MAHRTAYRTAHRTDYQIQTDLCFGTSIAVVGAAVAVAVVAAAASVAVPVFAHRWSSRVQPESAGGAAFW